MTDNTPTDEEEELQNILKGFTAIGVGVYVIEVEVGGIFLIAVDSEEGGVTFIGL